MLDNLFSAKAEAPLDHNSAAINNECLTVFAAALPQ
jgi:hypothetical protein